MSRAMSTISCGAALTSAALALALAAAPASLAADPLYAHGRPHLSRGCGSCHVGHGKRKSQMLPAAEEQLCFKCHGSSARRAEQQRQGRLSTNLQLRDVSLDFRLPFRHPVERSGLHQPGERLPERSSRAPRHVECVDCHRAHRTLRTRQPLAARHLPRRSPLDGRSPEYKLCYRCHSDSLNLPRNASNVQRRFSPRNRSYHPVEAAGRGSYVPSLRSPLTTSSMISCGDCHGNDSGRGIHGSRYQYLLRKHYSTVGRAAESTGAYALCYSCHDRSVLFSGRGFSEHERHVRRARTSCAVCHNAHGSFSAPHLMEFSTRHVKPDRVTGKLSYVSLGRGQGICYVSCHGVNHSGVEYCEAGSGACMQRKSTPVRAVPLRKRMRGSPFSF